MKKSLLPLKIILPATISILLISASIFHSWVPKSRKSPFKELLGRIDPASSEILPGLPAPQKIIGGRLKVITDPIYRTNYYYDVFVKGLIIIPLPFDVLKPEVFLPLHEVKAGDKPLKFPEERIDLSNVSYYWNGREKTLREFLLTTETDIIAFLQNGRIIYDDYANGWSPDMRSQIWSATKSFTSALIGIALHEGKIDSLDDKIDNYVEELKGTAWEGTSIENLLCMESGIYWDEIIDGFKQWGYLILDNLTEGKYGKSRNETLIALKRVHKPGSVFKYNSAATQVLAWLLETVYDTGYAPILSEKIWIPAGMTGDAFIMTDRRGGALASQGLYARVYDLARFCELYRNGGKSAHGIQVIPAEWVKASLNFSEKSGYIYGYQWWSTAPNPGFQALGFQGQQLTVIPETGLTAIRLGHQLGLRLKYDKKNTNSPGGVPPYVEVGYEEWGAAVKAVSEYLNK